MKMHLPPALVRKLMALASCTLAASPLAQANITQKAWESGTQIDESKKVTLITVNSSALEKPFSIDEVSYLTLASGVTPTFHPSATHFNWQGELLDSSGAKIIDPDTGLTLGIGTAVSTKNAIEHTWNGKTTHYAAGTIVIGTKLNNSGATYTDDFYASDYQRFNTGTSTALYIDENTTVDNFYMGKTNESWGAAGKEASTTLIIGTNNTSVNFVLGANQITEDATANADFLGTSTIITKEGAQLDGANIIGAHDVYEGAKYAGDFSGKVQISLQSSSDTANTIIGGSRNEANNASTFGKNGESSVEIYLRNGASALQIIGGNSGYAGSFTGDVNIEVNGQVNSVVGAGYMRGSSDAQFTGDTHIKITNPSTDGSARLYGNLYTAEQSLIGGFAANTGVNYSVYPSAGVHPGNVSFPSVNYEGKTATINGKTQIELDFTSAPSSEAQYFSQALVGGSLIGNGLTLTHTGSSELSVTGADNIQFSKWVVGGNLVSDTTDGSYYTGSGNSFPYHTRENMASASIDSVVVRVDSGDFSYTAQNDTYGTGSLFTVGSMSAGGGNVTTGRTHAEITGGKFGVLIGGNTSDISDQNFDGSSFKDTTSGATKVDNVTLDVSGDASAEMIVGGSYLSDNVTAVTGIDPESGANGVHMVNAADVGDVNVNITGGTHGDITSGSYIGQHISQSEAAGEGYLITQGNLSLSVKGNSHIDGQVIAGAGIINGAGPRSQGSADELSSSIARYYYEDYFNKIGGLEEGGNPMGITPTLYPDAIPVGQESEGNLNLRAETASTQVEIGSDIVLTQATTITGGYVGKTAQSIPGEGGNVELPEDVMAVLMHFGQLVHAFSPEGEEPNEELHQWALSWQNALIQDLERAAASLDMINYVLNKDNVKVTGNRQLVFNDKANYANLANATIIEFDEVQTGAGTTVDFGQNNQDLDLLEGRHNIGADGIHVVDGDFSGTNTVRKTGAGTLVLDDVNGQVNKATPDAESNLQLVVEAGTVALAKESADTSKTDFKTLVVQSGATLDMRAGNYDATTGEYVSGNAGINGDLRLEMDSILLVDASRDTMGSGTALEGGSLQIIGEGQVTLQFDNLDLVQKNQTAEAGHLLFEAGSQYFEIVLFSELDFLDELSTNILFDITGGTFEGVAAEGVLASKYFKSNLDLSDVYLVYNANGDMVLTGATPPIPEPSTATLSLLALAGLLARRRRKAI